MKPPFPYLGAKTRLALRIAALIPPDHDHYIEACGGSLAVLLAKQPSPVETVNDIDGSLVTFWRVLRDRPDELIRACQLTPHARSEYYQAIGRGPEPGGEIEAARRVFVMLTQGTSRTTRPSSMWAKYVKTGTKPYSTQVHLWADRLAEAAARIAGVSLECRSATSLIAKYGRDPRTVIYVDPPYLAAVRTARSQYLHEASDDDHKSILAAATEAAATVIISGYPHPLYEHTLAGWWHTDFAARAGGRDGRSAPRVERVWMNRVTPC